MNSVVTNIDENVMKLLHYFITVKGYNPIVLHGAENEIWLENMDSDYRIVRIVSNYIHNDEQFKFDVFRTKQIVKKIKKQTFSINMNTLSFFINLGDNVNIDKFNNSNNIVVSVKDMDDLKKSDVVMKSFPDITNEIDFKETGIELFMKLTGDINKKNEKDKDYQFLLDSRKLFSLERKIPMIIFTSDKDFCLKDANEIKECCKKYQYEYQFYCFESKD